MDLGMLSNVIARVRPVRPPNAEHFEDLVGAARPSRVVVPLRRSSTFPPAREDQISRG